MRIILILLLLLLLLAAPVDASPPFSPEAVTAYGDGIMREGMEANDVAGGSLAIVKDGHVLASKGYGIARIAPQPQEATATTLFQVASISKTPVFIAIMQLVEAGRLRLDDPVNLYLPPDLQISGSGFRRPILIRHLMTHSAGFEDTGLGTLEVDRPDRLSPLAAYLAQHRPRRVREPGLQSSYSNYGEALLAIVIERISGMDFPTYMERRVLRPLGMVHATYRYPYSAALAQARGLPAPMAAVEQGNSTQQLAGTVTGWKPTRAEWIETAPSGGLWASADDMAAYMLALSDPARMETAGVLKASTFAMMMRPGVPLPGTEHLGFGHYWLRGGHQGFGHGGSMMFGASNLVIVPELHLGIFVSTNSRGGFDFAKDLADRFLMDFAPEAEAAPVRSTETRAMARLVAGDWIWNRRNWTDTQAALTLFQSTFSVTALPNGDLMQRSLFGKPTRYEPLGGGIWRSVRDGSRLIYAADADGTPALWNGHGSGSAVRATLFQRLAPVLTIMIVALLAAIGVTLWAVRQIATNWPTTLRERLSISLALAAGVAWALGIGLFLAIVARAIPDHGVSIVFDYPGPMVAAGRSIALAVFLTGASIGTIALSWETYLLPARAMIGRVVALAVFAAATVVCWSLNLVGYWPF